MGVPAADVRYVLESLSEIEDALCSVPSYAGPPVLRAVDFVRAVELLKTLKAELEAIA